MRLRKSPGLVEAGKEQENKRKLRRREEKKERIIEEDKKKTKRGIGKRARKEGKQSIRRNPKQGKNE
jgi:hypothetical protein